ncbi:MAG: 50S ribosomal protein L6 [Candidatus Marsarchaeota archaeon]|jgi:large subunit ribosomal protein L6|nr:50S ribosomal protein L6 [Candidatus Marsarchaeota archaeon]
MEEVAVPEGIEIRIDGDKVITKGALGMNERAFNHLLLTVESGAKSVKISAIDDKKLAKKANQAAVALANEVRSDISGVTKNFEIVMEAVYAHFPMTLEVKGSELLIKNMFGERMPRPAAIVGSTKIEIKGKDVKVYGTKHDDVSQTAANIRQACKVHGKDTRVFQDGVYYASE